MTEPRLKWVPLPMDGSIGPPRGLKDFQVGWFWNLFWAALTNAELPGYLPVVATPDNLWTFAGAHRRAHWDAKCALVMAAFELRDVAGQKRWCLPVLASIIGEQKKKLRNHKKGADFTNEHSIPQGGGSLSLSPSQFGFDFDVIEPELTQKQRKVSLSRAWVAPSDGYSQSDFDARDIRRMAEAYAQLSKRNAEGATLGSSMSARQMFEYACEVAGISISRGLELEEQRRKWPERVPDWAKQA
jgi:hypothetical protein